MASTAELNVARKKLIDSIGDNSKMYFAQMKLWFRQKITKVEFDTEARKLLTPDTVKFHNEFLLAILNKCQSLTSTHASKDSSSTSHNLTKEKLRKGKGKKKARSVRATFEHRFRPANPLAYGPQVVPKDPAEEERVALCSREATLPALAMVHGRMFITAWDCGLDNVEDDAVRLMLFAVEHHLKSILTTVFTRRNGYSLREGRFVYAMGTPTPDPYRRRSFCGDSPADWPTGVSCQGDHVPSIKPTYDQAEANAVYHLACSKERRSNFPPVCIQDVFEALQVHRSIIQSHTIYAINMERMISRFWHPTHEDLEQNSIKQQETELRQQMQIHI